MMLPINNTTEDFFLLRQLQFNLQSLKFFIRRSFNNSVIHCFIYVHSNISSRKGCRSKLEHIVSNISLHILASYPAIILK